MGILRFLLALAVLLQHAGPLLGLKMTGGDVAVQAFFIISGFYMTLILEEKYARVAQPYRLFMGNRLLRLFPAYLVVLALTLLSFAVVQWTTGLQLGTRWGGIPAWVKHGGEMSGLTRLLLVLTNLGLYGQDWTLFSAFDPQTGSLHFMRNALQAPIPAGTFLLVPQAWTLGLELTFYLMAPFLVRRRWWVVAGLAGASLALRGYDAYALGLGFDPWTYRFFPHELALFLAGCLGCKAYRTWLKNGRFDLRRLGGVTLGLLVLATLFYPKLPGGPRHIAYLLAVAGGIPILFALTKDWRWDRRLGELSYPLYISHILLLPYVIRVVKMHPALSQPALLVPGTLLLAVAIHLLVERPIDRLRQRRVAGRATTGEAPALSGFAALPRRTRFLILLGGGVGLGHLIALCTFGATFWVDSDVYAALGDALFSAKKLKVFYDAVGLLSYSHFGAGEPALWVLTGHLPDAWRWPALALLQHAAAAAATCWLFATAHRLWPSWWHLAGAALLTAHPFYQAMHNALMTESIASSIMLAGLACALRLLFLGWTRRDFFAFLALTALAVQFRSYNGPMLSAIGALVLWQRRREIRWTALAALLIASLVGALAFPVYRLALTGVWVLPGAGTNPIVLAKWLNLHPSPALLARLRALGTIPEDQVEAIFTKSFSYEEAAALGQRWLAEGASLSEANSRAARIVHEIQADGHGFWPMKLRCGLSSSGFSWLGFAGPETGPVYQNLSLPEQQRFRMDNYRWMMWLKYGTYRGDAEWQIRDFHTPVANSASAQRALWRALRPWLPNCPSLLRDPLFLGWFVPDVFSVLGLLGAGLCLWRCTPLGLIVLVPLAANFALMTIAAVGSPRYAYGMLPLALFAFTSGLALCYRRGTPPRSSA